MKSSTRFFVGFTILVLLGFYGCGSNSDVEMKAAQQAMENAKSLGAEELAASNWLEAMQAWEQGQAAVAEGKSAKTYFIRAKSRFEKTATIAKSNRDAVAREISDLQAKIDDRFMKIKAAIDKGKVSSRVQKQLNPILTEVDSGLTSIEELIGQGNYLKARTTAQEIQKKVFNAELIMVGKKPVY